LLAKSLPGSGLTEISGIRSGFASGKGEPSGRLSDTPQEDVRIAIQRSHALLSDTTQPFDALDARSNFEPIMQSERDLNKLDDV
jgi:hypothetical protein